jgi:hypothetical protein
MITEALDLLPALVNRSSRVFLMGGAKIFRFMREILFHSRGGRAIVSREREGLLSEVVGQRKLRLAVKAALTEFVAGSGIKGEERDE